MNRRIFANLILYDIRKGFRENKIKWIVGVFIFVFFSFITVSDFSVNSPELGFLAYFTNILQGMPPYMTAYLPFRCHGFCFMHFYFLW